MRRPRFRYDHEHPVHSTCGGPVELPLRFDSPAHCLRCGERFSTAHELAVRIVEVR